MLKAVLLAAMMVTPAVAQELPNDPILLKHLIQSLSDQRNGAANEAAFAEAQLKRMQEIIGDLKKQNEDLQKKIGDKKPEEKQ